MDSAEAGPRPTLVALRLGAAVVAALLGLVAVIAIVRPEMMNPMMLSTEHLVVAFGL